MTIPRMMPTTRPSLRTSCLPFLLTGLFGCSSGSGGVATPTPPPKTSGQIQYGKHRDPSTNLTTPVLTESGAGFDAREVDSPAAVFDADRASDKFLLYYEASDGSGVSSIGLITSNEEDFTPTVVNRMEVVPAGPTGSAWAGGATDPTVLVDTRPGMGPTRYKMWFEGRSGANGETSTVVYATSPDGVSWSGYTPCTGLSATFAQLRIADPSVVLDQGVFKMWFEANDGAALPPTIGYAESSDAVTWVVKDGLGATGGNAETLLGPGSGPAFDAAGVGAPCVVLDTDIAIGQVGRYKLWFEATDDPNRRQSTIGYATSADGLIWHRVGLPVITPSSDSINPPPFDNGDIEHPSALLQPAIPATSEGHFLLYYTGDGEANATPNRIGLARGRQ